MRKVEGTPWVHGYPLSVFWGEGYILLWLQGLTKISQPEIYVTFTCGELGRDQS